MLSYYQQACLMCLCVGVWVHTCVCIYVYIYVYISLSPKTVRVTCIDLVVLIVTCSSLRVSQRLLILIMKKHGRCVDISKDHLKHSGRNLNSGHSTVLCTCIHVILNKDVHQKKKKKNRPRTHLAFQLGPAHTWYPDSALHTLGTPTRPRTHLAFQPGPAHSWHPPRPCKHLAPLPYYSYYYYVDRVGSGAELVVGRLTRGRSMSTLSVTSHTY